MSLEVELDCDGLLSKHEDQIVFDTEESNSHSILRNAEHFTEDDNKDSEEEEEDEEDEEEEEETDNDSENRSRRKSINVNINTNLIKQRELMQHLEELKQEFSSRINILESNLESVSRERDSFESKANALKQQNQYLQDNANECKNKYNQTKKALESANEEILDLKTELVNLQLLYEEEINMVKTENTIKFSLEDETNENSPINQKLQEYMKENLEIRKENKKYLNQLKQINDKCRESNIKYNDLHNIQIDLQNELNASKSRCAELNDIVHEYFSEIQSLENQNADLKQTVIFYHIIYSYYL